jgi:hypothetical protein
MLLSFSFFFKFHHKLVIQELTSLAVDLHAGLFA